MNVRLGTQCGQNREARIYMFFFGVLELCSVEALALLAVHDGLDLDPRGLMQRVTKFNVLQERSGA